MIETLVSEGLTGFAAQSPWEWLAAGLGIAYVWLAAKESAWCWPAAFVSTLIYTLLFWQGQLPMQSLLNLYYLVMAVYGWQQWRYGKIITTEKAQPLSISKRTLKFHLTFIAIGILTTIGLGNWMQMHSLSVAPFLDAGVTTFSVMTTYLMVKKVLENWLYWLVIDSAAIILYWQNGYYPTLIMFTVYLVIAIYGYFEWRKLFNEYKPDKQLAHSKTQK